MSLIRLEKGFRILKKNRKFFERFNKFHAFTAPNFFPKLLQDPPLSQHQILKEIQVSANQKKQTFRKTSQVFDKGT